MYKKYSSILILISGILFAQTTDLEKDKIFKNPHLVEESFTKAFIKTNIIEDYIQEYHTKTYYNPEGNKKNKEYFSENGDLLYTETFTYTEDQKLIKSELSDPERNMVVIKDYEYNSDGFVETKSENEIVTVVNEYKINDQGNIIYNKETSLIDNNIFTEKTNEYKNNQLIKTVVKYGKDGYIINYKYNQLSQPIEEVIFDLKNNLVSKKRRKFDEKSNIVEEFLYDSQGKLKTNNRILYEYDENKNWLKRTQYANNIEQPISNTMRTIKY